MTPSTRLPWMILALSVGETLPPGGTLAAGHPVEHEAETGEHEERHQIVLRERTQRALEPCDVRQVVRGGHLRRLRAADERSGNARDRDARYQSAVEFRDALRALAPKDQLSRPQTDE